jgi:hypothetical protein
MVCYFEVSRERSDLGQAFFGIELADGEDAAWRVLSSIPAQDGVNVAQSLFDFGVFIGWSWFASDPELAFAV